MAATKEWHLGDVPPPGYKLVRESHELPKTSTREQILEKLGEVLGKGALRVTVEATKPIEIVRIVKSSEHPTADDFDLSDLYGMVRNADVKEVEFVPSATVLVRLMDLFLHIRETGHTPMAALVGSEKALREWLGYSNVNALHVMGLPTVVRPELPEDVLLIACHLTTEDSTEVDLSFKITLDKPEEKQ